MRRVSKAEGVISQMTSAITAEDWSLQHCHDYLVELEMVTSGALMALRLTANDIGSDLVSMQAECIGSRAREARNMALELRQKHLDTKLQVKDRPARVFQEALGGTSGPGSGGWRGYDGPQFSGRLEDLREFRRSWDEYERQYYPKEPEEVLVEILHTQAGTGAQVKEGRRASSQPRYDVDVPGRSPLGAEGEDRQPPLRHPQGAGARWTGGIVPLLQKGMPVPEHRGR
jgi:hypothetical protein